jgi:hypothetical protein
VRELAQGFLLFRERKGNAGGVLLQDRHLFMVLD